MGIPEPSTDVGRAGLAALLAQPRSAVVALDFDGTLAPIVADPAAARAEPAAVAALRALLPLVGGVVVVTGRPAAVAVEYGGFERLGLTVLGQYGAERWEGGVLTAPEPPPGVAAVRAELPAVLGESGAWVEDKGRALAVHTRRTADPQALLDGLRGPLTELADRHGLMVEPGRYVLELRPPGVDKGGALTEYLAGRPGAAVLYAGDDLGDLPAYAALERRRKDGGPAVLVCSSAVTGERQVAELADRADLLVPGPTGVAELLTELAAALR
ncbi:trehalose-phosphatase [Kitasatospora sp. NPDC096147]|uniref:trehalose-phosphatase n=1 Tax=Kitasatospora sp. NPDC096147 TaxID=3364093 RepID=UPI00382870F0